MDRFLRHFKQPFTSVWISLGFVIGCISTVFYYQTHEFTVITISVLIASAYFKPFLNVLLGFILAICCIVVHFYLFYSYTLPNDENNYAYPATILVDDVISAKQPQYIKATLLKLNGDEIHKFKAPKAMLSVDSAQLIKQGDTFEATIALKKFRTIKNIGVFDNNVHAFKQRILFKGKVLNKQLRITSAASPSIIYKYRSFLKHTYQKTTLNWLYYALLSGDKSLMSFENKQTMQSLGLSHLLAISGLHIGLIFSCFYLLSKYTAYILKINVLQSINLSIIYCFIGWLAAFIYVYLSEFLLSATRAFIMLSCVLGLYFIAKQPLRWRSILYALVAVLLINPFNVLNPGLYFSFIAVAIIFLVIKYLPKTKYNWLSVFIALCIIQLALFIGLLPITLIYFNGVSIAGLVINLLAIPLLSVVIMPFLLLFTIISAVVDITPVILLFDSVLITLFKYMDAIPWHYRWLDIAKPRTLYLVAAYLCILITWFSPFKRLALIPLCVTLIDYLYLPKPLWQLHVFDVGHGLMTLLEKDNQALVYDFGPSYFNRFSRTYSVLIPYLKKHNLTVSDAIISHQDNDHAGGAAHFINAGYGESFKRFHPHGTTTQCISLDYNFNGLRISSFADSSFNNENDNSCVLLIKSPQLTMLLTGDISKARELSLIKTHSLQADVILSPHHGSDTSSSTEFINHVNPNTVIHSTAFQGQWQFPSEKVVSRYKAINAKQYVTARDGQITVSIYQDSFKVTTARKHESYWFIED
ncbi:DNA internalization-related competence protein ComEC/Rec2 [Pseudoalteromonas sp. Angola-4]|uniref:DNA internalization-related competence protein ComEC/Rec2 n=1 Tax=Pseudoalteromonas sp. Angola-4 TaxID=3025335 RepID=UPI00235A032D|nr:DNA internalization-related competence protein ComEC/Rec2 [Pseudoalteromonas sp. Angola-4]MDC9508206.1 DNA internalization-related competence protein ComEC/Rec2 [Pseudoalteromonas sp. Angola-4]